MANDLEFLQKLDHPEDRTRSLIDLIDVQTVDLELAAFFASHIWRGASYITGSGPGGIGKTTTMHALLSFVAVRPSLCHRAARRSILYWGSQVLCHFQRIERPSAPDLSVG